MPFLILWQIDELQNKSTEPKLQAFDVLKPKEKIIVLYIVEIILWYLKLSKEKQAFTNIEFERRNWIHPAGEPIKCK